MIRTVQRGAAEEGPVSASSPPRITVCVPTYHGTPHIEEMLESTLGQSFRDFDVVITNDSTDDHDAMERVIAGFNDDRLSFHTNPENLGYPGNLAACMKRATGDFVLLMAQDDVFLDEKFFERVVDLFDEHPEVGVVTRPYYWFEDDVRRPIRMTHRSPASRFIGSESSSTDLRAMYETLGQLSGLVYRRECIALPVCTQVFTAHIRPWLSVLRTHKAYYWEGMPVAIRTSSSQTRFLSSIYRPSPTATWVQMFREVFAGEDLRHAREVGIEHIATNHLGLVQIKNYGHFSDLVADMRALVSARPRNFVDLRFWFFAMSTLLVPRFVTRRLVDYYKNVILRGRYKQVLDPNTRPVRSAAGTAG